MADDIVTRLRDDATAMRNTSAEDRFFAVLGVYARTNDAAADEIERLREKIQDLRMHAEQDACEIERLRARLGKAENEIEWWSRVAIEQQRLKWQFIEERNL